MTTSTQCRHSGKKVSVCTMPRREAFTTLNIDAASSPREIRRRHAMLARKHQLGKWCDRCRLAIKEGENMFKNASNAHAIVGGQVAVMIEDQ